MVRLGPTRLSTEAAHKLAPAAAIATVIAALILGVATAAVPRGRAEATVSGGLVPARPVLWRPPIHRLVAAHLRGEAPGAPAQGRVLAGSLVELDPTAAIVRTGPGQTRVLHLTSRTRLPRRRPEPGDGILAIGQPLADGTFVARAVLARPARGTPATRQEPAG